MESSSLGIIVKWKRNSLKKNRMPNRLLLNLVRTDSSSLRTVSHICDRNSYIQLLRPYNKSGTTNAINGLTLCKNRQFLDCSSDLTSAKYLRIPLYERDEVQVVEALWRAW